MFISYRCVIMHVLYATQVYLQHSAYIATNANTSYSTHITKLTGDVPHT